jgi:helix-turn-helix protein
MGKQEELENLLVVEGINAQGFGTIAKLVMRDKRLKPESKAIYAYIASFAGSGSTAFPGASLMCEELRMTDTRFYKYRKALEQLGYIEIIKQRENGKRAKNIYKLIINPIEKIQHSQIDGVEKNEENFQHSQIQGVEIQGIENRGTISNSSISNSNTNIKNIVNKKTPLTDEQVHKIYLIYMKKGMSKALFQHVYAEYQENIKKTVIKKTHSAYFKGMLKKTLENKNGVGNTENINSDLPTLQVEGMY